ncbi:MAG: hypothetical protein JNL01_02985 [Bdellovibrionales bacterium]|nr:hypothetical protein [Bdellovibrionales bacterium]
MKKTMIVLSLLSGLASSFAMAQTRPQEEWFVCRTGPAMHYSVESRYNTTHRTFMAPEVIVGFGWKASAVGFGKDLKPGYCGWGGRDATAAEMKNNYFYVINMEDKVTLRTFVDGRQTVYSGLFARPFTDFRNQDKVYFMKGFMMGGSVVIDAATQTFSGTTPIGPTP